VPARRVRIRLASRAGSTNIRLERAWQELVSSAAGLAITIRGTGCRGRRRAYVRRRGVLPGDVLQVEARYDDTEATILLGGEFDMTGVARFWGYLSAVLAPHPLSITVDASGLEFIDSSGLMALVRARDAAAEAGVAFRVRAPSPLLRRIAELCGVADLLWAE